jgi:predicted ATPase
MKIKLTRPYKSLSPFESEDLPAFAIIIGKNGSGKSQLVEKILQLSQILSQKRKTRDLEVIPEVSSIFTGSILIDSIREGDPTEYRNKHLSLYQSYSECINEPSIRKVWNNLYLKQTNIIELHNLKMDGYDDIFKVKEFFSSKEGTFVDSDLEYLGMESQIGVTKETLVYYKQFLSDLKSKIGHFEIALFVAKKHNKSIVDLTESDFFNSGLPEKFFETNHIIESKIEDVFYSYLRRRQKNEFDLFRKQKKGIKNLAMDSAEFNKIYPNPIDQINNLLSYSGLPYYFKNIGDEEFSSETKTSFDFIKKTNETKIDFKSLSSGEKIILGLIIRLFTSEFYKLDLQFPELIVLDEPDAHLHPEMSKLLLDILNEAFVKKIGMKIIITTHSPTTVALAPEDSIFQLNNEPSTFLKKITKDEGLKILTTGLPNLSIDYKNHRQIFVESPTDLYYYQTIFNKLNRCEKQTHQLYFISAGYGKSNRDFVRNVVQELQRAGNKSCYGIIDWDKTNKNSSSIFVHGAEKRYSIENYIFDPLIVSILLLELRFGELRKVIGYSDQDNQYNLIKTDKAQLAIDYIIRLLEPRNKEIAMDSRPLKQKYGSYIYNLPFWITTMNGHALKEQITDQFECIANIKLRGEFEIEKRLIDIIGKLDDDAPEDTVSFLKQITSLQS